MVRRRDQMTDCAVKLVRDWAQLTWKPDQLTQRIDQLTEKRLQVNAKPHGLATTRRYLTGHADQLTSQRQSLTAE